MSSSSFSFLSPLSSPCFLSLSKSRIIKSLKASWETFREIYTRGRNCQRRQQQLSSWPRPRSRFSSHHGEDEEVSVAQFVPRRRPPDADVQLLGPLPLPRALFEFILVPLVLLGEQAGPEKVPGLKQYKLWVPFEGINLKKTFLHLPSDNRAGQDGDAWG